ncbi:TIGR03617 family F420-dependent LLM class oxidoreductase [Kitasatospora sp. NBC_01560]|uniref:TIGR03617 family F420-dependent LLM class oxidoreductase n=1 Tax=Kitasatospora sp. NBC_01560 TaxID=2975965 RepID=UPI00386EA461
MDRPPAAALRLDATVSGHPAGVLDAAEQAERRGMDRVMVPETAYDPFLQLARAADRTSRVELATGVAVALARTPMTLAYQAWGLHAASGGRAVIGLGSQVKPHIEKRFGMPWDRPAARMHEYVHAVRAIWHSWQSGERLRFRGDFYTHTVMTPVFSPDPVPAGLPRILLAGVGPRMVRTAGAVADGFIGHPFGSVGHLTAQVLPLLAEERARAEAGQAAWTARPFEIVGQVLTATGRTEEELRANRAALRERLAFYASTPAYLPVLAHHGWEGLHEELHRLSLRGRWAEMAALIDDEVFDTFAVSGGVEEVARTIHGRFRGLVTRVSVSQPDDAAPALALDVLEAVRALG